MSKDEDHKFDHVADDHDEGGDEYRVGYGKPPKGSQFKKGQSGNPRGRPRTAYEEDDFPIRKFMLEVMTVKIGGKKQETTRAEALLMKLLTQAMAGHVPSAKLLLNATGGLKDIRQEWKRQKTQADQERIDMVWRVANEWYSDERRQT